MQSEEFILKVRERAGLADKDQAKRAIEAVLETLRARIQHASGDNVAAQLPKEIKDLWESGMWEHIQRSMGGFERLDLGAFLSRVATELGYYDINQAEATTRAVFATLQEQVTPGAKETITRELPQDLREFWETSSQPVGEVVQEGPPFEMEAPVVPTFGTLELTQEEIEARPWGPETDMPSGSDVEMIIAETEAQVRDRRTQEEQRREESRAWPSEAGGKEEEMPPAAERIHIEPSPEKMHGAASAGDATHYRSDPQLEDEIKSMLSESDELDASDINVFVQAGNVTLRGRVGSHKERDAAGLVAAKALGVGEILNELNIEESKSREIKDQDKYDVEG